KETASLGGFHVYSYHVDSDRAGHPGGDCLSRLRFLASQCPTAAAPSIAASLCSRLRHHYAANVDNYGLKTNEVADTRMGTPCFLIVHPRGSLIWDTGEIPDSAFKDGGSPQKLNNFTVDRPLLPQLAAIGYRPGNITFMALSHYHGDHVANANLFAGSTWIVQEGDRDPILAPRPANPPATGRVPDPKFFEGLANSKTIVLNGEDHDVFGDGTVVIKSTPGHTPGHQSLFLKLSKTGNVLLSGDLYHYPEEITFKKIPSFDTNKEQTAKSREM